LARWWARILVFIVIEAFVVMLYNIFYNFYFLVIIYVQIILVSMLIESGRKYGNLWTIGIRIDKWMLKDLRIATILIFSFILLIYLLTIILGAEIEVNEYLFSNDISSNYISMMFTNVFWIFIIVAGEEFLFRGIIFQAILERFGKIISVLLISILFALAHAQNPHFTLISFINTFLVNILLSIMYIQTRSLWQPIFFHFLWNYFLGFLTGSKISGFVLTNTFIDLDLNSFPTWLFGGDYGLEGGIIATIAILIFTPIVLKWSSVSPYLASQLFKMQYFEAKIINKPKMFYKNKNLI
jgi:uncharacterized protein